MRGVFALRLRSGRLSKGVGQLGEGVLPDDSALLKCAPVCGGLVDVGHEPPLVEPVGLPGELLEQRRADSAITPRLALDRDLSTVRLLGDQIDAVFEGVQADVGEPGVVVEPTSNRRFPSRDLGSALLDEFLKESAVGVAVLNRYLESVQASLQGLLHHEVLPLR